MSLESGQNPWDSQILTSAPVEAMSYRIGANHRGPIHSHDFHQLVFSQGGGGVLVTNSKRLLIEPDAVAIIPKGIRHFVRSENRVELKCVYFRGPLSPTNTAKVDLPSLVRELVLELTDGNSPEKSTPHLSACLYDQIGNLLQDHGGRILDLSKPLRRVCEALLNDPKSKASVAELAAAVGVSPRTLRRLAQRELGHSISDFKAECKMHRAAELLQSGLALSQVASDVGYDSDSAFYAAFKSKFGATPAKYAAQKRK